MQGAGACMHSMQLRSIEISQAKFQTELTIKRININKLSMLTVCSVSFLMIQDVLAYN